MLNAYIKTLQNSDKTQVIYPQTVSSAVIVESGNLYGGNSNEFLSDTLGRAVYTTTDQTITGTKTFSSNTIFNSSINIKNPSSNYYSNLVSGQIASNQTIYLPNVSMTSGLVGYPLGVAVGSNTQPAYINSEGIAQVVNGTAMLIDIIGDTAVGSNSQPVYWNGSAFTNSSEIFIAEYNVTPYSDIMNAINVNKTVFARSAVGCYTIYMPLAREYTGFALHFRSHSDWVAVNQNNSWSSGFDYFNATNATKYYILGKTGFMHDETAVAQASSSGTENTNGIYFQGSTGVLMGAAWNDYAEFRAGENVEPGRVVKEKGDDTLELADGRLLRGCNIVSDTFGFGIGENDNNKLPIAVSGRVLAYPYESREEFRKYIGYSVCSGPNGTVSIMTEEEERKYPSAIIGTISAVPDYKVWHGGIDIEVQDRIWIKVR